MQVLVSCLCTESTDCTEQISSRQWTRHFLPGCVWRYKTIKRNTTTS